MPSLARITVPAGAPRPASRHGAVERLFDDVFYVRGRMPSTRARPYLERWLVYYSRTMTIVRWRNPQGAYEITLFNTIRLDEAGLTRLEGMGAIRHVVRLGSFHGVDDAFYVNRYGATYWNIEGMTSAEGLEVEPRRLSEEDSAAVPIPGTRVFIFDELPYPEAIYLLPPTARRGGVAITTDSIQRHESIIDRDNSWLVSFGIWRIGLGWKTRLGPIWLREQTRRRSGRTGAVTERAIANLFRPQFDRLLASHDFDSMVPGHGWPLRQGTKAEIRRALEDQLPQL